MNPLIGLLFFFALLGAADKILGGRFGLAAEFDRGLSMMGSLCLSMSGVYCFAVLGGRLLAPWIGARLGGLPFSPSLLPAALLAPDMGGYSIASQIARTPGESVFSGVFLSSTLGTVVSFSLPIALGGIRRESLPAFMGGTVCGIATIPIALLAGGAAAGMPPGKLFANLLPVAAVCALLALGLWRTPEKITRAFSLFGNGVRVLAILLFAVLAAELFWGADRPIPQALISESFLIVAKVAVITCGSFILSKLALRFLGSPIRRLAGRLGVNQHSVIGLLLSLVTSVSMFAVFDEMDERGKRINAAFSVSAAYVFGGQLAFISSVAPGGVTAAYILSKLAGGLSAAALILLSHGKKQKGKRVS